VKYLKREPRLRDSLNGCRPNKMHLRRRAITKTRNAMEKRRRRLIICH